LEALGKPAQVGLGTRVCHPRQMKTRLVPTLGGEIDQHGIARADVPLSRLLYGFVAMAGSLPELQPI
jgi:hypothetical protein